MAHKTNYKDALFEQRKYRMQNNPDGTVTPIDETDYTQEGDRVGASEFNEIGNALNVLEQEMGKRELQTYTALSQLSLEAPVTLSQLITAMPDGSYAAIDCNGTSVVSDIPSGSAAGSLEVVKVGTSGSAKYTNTSNGQVYFWGNGQWYAALVDEMVLGTMEEIDANTDAGKVAGALAVKELSSELSANGIRFYFDYQDGQYGYNTDPARGADTFSPFNNPSYTIPDFTLGLGDQGGTTAYLPLKGIKSISFSYRKTQYCGMKISLLKGSESITIVSNTAAGTSSDTYSHDLDDDYDCIRFTVSRPFGNDCALTINGFIATV